MGFRSYIRHFLGAILLPFRPSLPWCFPIRGGCHLNRRSSRFLVAILILFRSSGPCCLSVAEAPFLSLEIREFLVAILTLFRPSLPWCFPIRELSLEEQQEQEQQQQKEKVAKKSSFSMGFRSYIRHFLGAILLPFRPSAAMVFSQRGGGAVSELFLVAKTFPSFPSGSLDIRHFLRRNFDAFPSFAAMVFSHPGAVF